MSIKYTAVTTARNDGYGGNLEERAAVSINSMVKFFDEVIYIDWNSPNDESLFDSIKQYISKCGKIRHIKVSQNLHNIIIKDPTAQLMVEVLANNTGIRRARGEFIASVNVDIIVADSLDKIKILDDKTFITVPRKDISLDDLYNRYTEKFSTDFDYTALRSDANRYFQHGYSAINKNDRWSLVDCCGDFQIAHRDVWFSIRGYEEGMVYRGYADTAIQRKADFYNYKLEAFFDFPVFHISHGGGFGGKTIGINDANTYIFNFNGTKNVPDWGLFNESFDEEIW